MSAMTDYGKLMDQSAAAPDAARTRQDLVSQIPTDLPPVVEPAELYGDLMDADGEQAKARMNVVLDVALKHQPDTAASDKSLAATMGLPIEVVERNRDEIQRIAKIKQVQALTTASPVLARQLGDPEFAKLAHDDVESLSAIEGTLRFAKSSGSAMVGGLYGASAGVVGVGQAGFDAASPFLEPLVGRILPGNPLQATAQGLDAYRQQIEATSKGWMPQGSGNIESGWYSGLASLSRNLAGLPLAFAPGGQAAALTAMTAPVFGQEFGAARDRGLPVANALTYGASQAAIEYATEKMPLSRLIGDVKAGETFLKTIGRQALLEVPNEQAATILQDLNEWAVLNPDKPFSGYLAERPDAAVQTLVATLVGVGGQTSVVKGVDYALNAASRQEQKAQSGAEGAQLLEQLNKFAAADKLLARDPETFERFVEQAAAESEVSHVYVDAEVLNQDGMGMRLAEVSPSVAAQLQTAIETGGSVAIPVQEYASRIAPTEHAAGLLDHLRTEEDGMSRAEARTFMETAQEQFQESVAIQEQQVGADRAFQASTEVVRQTVREQLEAVSRFTPQVNDAYTSMVGNFYAVQAARIGMTPEAMYKRYPLKINGVPVTMKEGFNQQDDQRVGTDAFKHWYGDWQNAAKGVIGNDSANFDERGTPDFDAVQRDRGLGANSDGAARVGDFTFPGTSGPVGRDGAPARFFHGTRDDITAFDGRAASRKDNGWLGAGFYFTSNTDDANYYSGAKAGAVDRNVMPVYVAVRNPYIASHEEKLAQRKWSREQLEQRTLELKRLGYDGVALAQDDGSIELVAFEPTQIKSVTGNSGSYDGANPDIRYSQNNQSTVSYVDAEQRSAMVQGTVDSLSKAWAQRPEITVVDSMNDSRVPEAVRDADAAQRSQGATGEPEGFWYQGQVYLVGSALPTSADAARVLYHEVLGHHGLRGHFGKGLDSALDQIAQSRQKDVEEKAHEYGLNLDDAAHVRYAAEEVLAELAQTQPELGLVQKAVSAIRNFLRKHVPGMSGIELSDADIIQGYLLPARGWVQRGRRDKEASESVLNQSSNGPVRGTFAPNTLTISLLANADLSTFLHESGHFFLEVQLDMVQRLEGEAALFGSASLKDSEREVIADAHKLLEWFGVSDMQAWFNMTLEEKRHYHEQFARGFEAYLAEGNAPSVEMQGIFQRFRAWMIAVYKDLKRLDVELTADVRAVMDRMIASTEEIKVAEMGRSMAPLFATADMAGMTPETFAAYQKEGVAATQAAIDELQAKGMRDMQWLQNYRLRALRKLNQEAKAQRAELEMEARSQVMSQQVYQAWQFLTGKQEEGGFPAGRISTLELAAMLEMPAEQVELLKARKMTAKDGLHPLMVAERFGYDSAEAMIYDLSQAVPPKEAITQLTDQMMLEQFGELATAEAISRAADQAVHNQVRARMIATELKSITKATGSPREMAAAAKAFATQMIARQRIMDIKPLEYSRAETRAAKAAAKALAAGDTQKSGIEKRNQLLNAQAARQGHDTQDEVKRAVRYLRGLLSGKGKIDPGYRDQIAAMLERFSLTNVSNVATERRQSLASWIEQQRELGIEPDLAPELVTEAFRQNWREMTVEQFRGLVEAIQQIEHLGRLKHKLLAIKDKREFEAVRDAVVASIREHYSGKTPDQYSPATNAETLKLRAHQFFVDHLKVANISQAMDGGETGGEMWGFFVRSAQERANWKATKQADLTEKLMEIMIPVLKRNREMRKREFYPALGMSMTREQVFAIALNLGNEGNISRLLTGGLNGRKVSMQDLVGIVESRLTAEDLQAVQAIWDLMGTLAPEAQAKNKRVYGVEMAMVEPMPLVTKHGTLRGGYYPIVYDPRGTVRNADISEEQAAKEALQSARTAASTRRTYTKTRSSKTPYPLMLSFDGVHRGLTQVVHDLAWHEWSIDTGRMLRDVEFQQAVRETYGKDYLDTIKRWHDDIVLENTREHDAFSKASLVMRSNISVAAMGYSLLTAIQQPIGITQSIGRYGKARMAKAVAAFAGSPKAKTKEAFELSEFMRNRSRSRYREVSEMKSQIDLSGNKLAEANRFMVQHAFDLMGWVQLSVDIPTWWAGYEQALEQGNDEAKSIAMADQGVIDSQGDGAIQNLSAMQRSKIGKIFTLFYSYLSSALNMIYQTSKSERSLARKTHDLLMYTMIPATMTAFLKWAILPSDDDDDSEEKYWRLVKEIIKENVALPMSMFVVVREFAGLSSLAVGEVPYAYSGPAGVRVFGDTAAAMGQTYKAISNGEVTGSTRKSLIALAGSAAGLPAAQINRTINGIQALAEGETTNPASIGFGFQRTND